MAAVSRVISTQLVHRGEQVEGAVRQGVALVALGGGAVQDKAAGYDFAAGLCLDDPGSAGRIMSAGVGGAAKQAVHHAQLYQHGAKVVGFGSGRAAFVLGHLAFAQLGHGLHHFLEAWIGGGVDKLHPGKVHAVLPARAHILSRLPSRTAVERPGVQRRRQLDGRPPLGEHDAPLLPFSISIIFRT